MNGILKTLLFCLTFCLVSWSAMAQRTITGTVRSDESGDPLIGVNITVKGTTTGTVTDIDGTYSIEASTGQTLVFSYIGYATQEVVVQAQNTIDAYLQQGEQLQEVVVTALGISREKKALGYAVQEVGGESLVATRQPNIVNALQGQVAGVQINSSGGGPGESARIIIRGATSLDPSADNQPLFIVDGIPVNNQTITAGSYGRNLSNRIADINPDDIENITILKGGAASALYGLRAANGAVVITTKKGQAGKLTVDFSTTYSIEEVNKFPETQRVYTQGFNGEYDPNSFWPTWGSTVAEARQLDPSHPETIFNNFENAYRQGDQLRTSLSMSGGSEKATFRSSLSYQTQDGVLPFSNYENISARVSGQFKASEKFTFGGTASYTNSGGDRVLAESFNERLVYWAPRVDVTDFEKPDGTMKGYRNDGNIGNNPIYGAKTNKYTDDVDRILGSFNFNFTPWKWVSLNYRVGLDQYLDSRANTGPGPRGVQNENVFEDNGDGFVNAIRIRSNELTSNLNATFNVLNSDAFDVQLLVGHDIYERNYNRVSTFGRDLDIYNLFNLNNAAVITTDQYFEEYRLMGLYGDVSVSFQDALFLNVTGRNDWSSALPEQNRSFFYPSVSLGYVFSEQFDLPEFWTFGKLRLSYAEIGKDTRPYRTSVNYGSAPGFPIESTTGWTRANQKGFSGLKPELTSTYEIGADLRFFNNRLGVDVTWYQANSKDQILPVPVSNTTGYSTFILNAGEIENKGLEAVITATPVRKSNFNWDVNINITTNKNRVVSIREGIDEILLGSHFGYAGATASLKLVEGQPYGAIFGTSYQRYYENPANEDPLVVDQGRPIVIGANGFPVRSNTQRVIGKSQPDWFGSIINTITYKDFSLSFMIDTRQGVQKYNQMDNFFAAFGIAPYTLNRNETIVFDGVLANGSPNTKPVWLGQGTGPDGENYGAGYYRNVYRGITENFVEDADWIRLRNLSLTYNLPQSLIRKASMSNASLTFTGYNLWLDTPFSGFDPEGNRANGNGDDGFGGFTYPSVRRYSFTLNVTF